MLTKARTALFSALLIFVISTRAAVPPAEELLPADTLFVLTVPDFTALKGALQHSPRWLFWNDPAMKPFHDKFLTKWNDSLVAPLERDLGINVADFADLPRGQLTFAVTQNNWDGGNGHSPGLLLLLDAKDKGDVLKTNLAALQKKWINDGKPIRTEIIRGLSFSIVTVSSNDIPAALSKIFPKRPTIQELGRTPTTEKPGEFVIGQSGSLLIAGNSIDAVAPVVAHLTGSSMPALNDNAAFAADKLSQFRDAPLYFAWFNAKTFFNVVANISTPPNPEAPTVFPQPQWTQVLGTSGLTGMTSMSIAYRQNHDGALLNFFIAVPEPARDGVFKIFSTRTKSAGPPVFVPADAIKFWRWRVDGRESWSALQKRLGDISPGVLAGLNAVIDAANATGRQNNPGFNVRKYLFENLGDDFLAYQKIPGDAPANATSAHSLFLFGVHDSDRAVPAVQTILALAARSGQKPPEPRNFQGHKIFAIPLPAPRVIGAQAPPHFLYCSTSDDYVALSTEAPLLEEYLRSSGNPPKPLNGVPGLVDAAQHVGGAGQGLFGYQNQNETVRQLFTTLKNAPANRFISLPVLPKGVTDWMDFSLLPDYNRVSKYFYFSVFAGNTTADGMSLKIFVPRPPQLSQ